MTPRQRTALNALREAGCAPSAARLEEDPSERSFRCEAAVLARLAPASMGESMGKQRAQGALEQAAVAFEVCLE